MNKIPYAVEYIIFDPNNIPPEIKKSEDLKKYVLLETQGSAIELIETSRTALTMFIFNILHQVCPEVVLTTYDGKKYMIYDHTDEAVIHSVDIDKSLVIVDDPPVSGETQIEYKIDLTELLNEMPNTNIVQNVQTIINRLRAKIIKTEKLTIIGHVPLLLLLSIQHLYIDNTRQLFYQKDTESIPKRVK